MTTPGATPGKLNNPRNPPYKLAAIGLIVFCAVVSVAAYMQFRGDFYAKTLLTMVAERAGLVMEPGSKVTYNGVEIGRVESVSEVEEDGKPAAKFVLDVHPRYIGLIPANVIADIKATTVFGNKYVAFQSPKDPSPQRITPQRVIHASSVTTEFNTLFQTVYSIAEKVDPVKLNLTLSAAAEALSGLGDKFGQSLVNANAILDDINPQMPQLRSDFQRLAKLGNTYADAAPDLFDFLNNAPTTARTITAQEDELDAALLASVGFGNTGADVLGRGAPYLQRGLADLVPTAKLLDTYSPELYCTLRKFDELSPRIGAVLGGNHYSLNAGATLVGAPNPYVYPDNLPRVNAHGGPGGAPGCWQTITHDLWPAPYLVMDTGASIAPYNHFEIGSPYAIEYVWGRQVGENTINP